MCVNTLMIQIEEKYEISLNIVRQIIEENKCKSSLYMDGKVETITILLV